MTDHIYWFITVFNRFDKNFGIKNARTWGFFVNKEEALDVLKNNRTDLWEYTYNYAVLEPYYEGISGYCFDEPREWFRYDETIDSYIPLDKSPEEVKGYVSFAIG